MPFSSIRGRRNRHVRPNRHAGTGSTRYSAHATRSNYTKLPGNSLPRYDRYAWLRKRHDPKEQQKAPENAEWAAK